MESDSDSDSGGFVVTLNHSNFYNTVLNHRFVVVKFYIPKLSRRYDLASKYEEAAQLFGSNDQVVFAKVNAEDEKYLLAKYGFLGVPAILIFTNRGTEIQKYQGPIDSKGIKDCLERLRVPLPEVDATQLGGKKNVIVGYFSEFSGPQYKNFVIAAKRLRWDYDFYQRTDHLLDVPVIRLLNPLLPENKEKPFETKDFNVDAILEFVKDRTMPAVIDYDVDPQELVANFFCGEINNDKVMLFVDRNGLTPSAISIETKYREFAMRNQKRGISFMIGSPEASQDAFQFFKLYKMAIAPLIVIQTTRGEIYWKEKLESENDIEAFMGKCKEDKLLIPRENIGPEKAKEVYAENFQDVVIDSGKNVFLVLGMWFEHCNALARIIDDVATHFKDDDNVVIAKLYHDDPETRSKGLNDYDPYATKDCPTLHFKRASRKKFMLYHGLTTSKEYIIQFIETNRDMAKPLKMESLEDVCKLLGAKRF